MLRQEASPLSVRGAGTRSAGGMNSLSSADRLPGQMVEKNRNAYWRLTAATFKCSRETPDLALELEIHLSEQSFFFFLSKRVRKGQCRFIKGYNYNFN